MRHVLYSIAVLALVSVEVCRGQPEMPVAVRAWEHGKVTIETWWGIEIAIDSAENARPSPVVVPGSWRVEIDIDDGRLRPFDVTVDRLPNTTELRLTPAANAGAESGRSVRLRTVAPTGSGAASEGPNLLLVDTPSARIAMAPPGVGGEDAAWDWSGVDSIDLLVLPLEAPEGLTPEHAASVAKASEPRIVAPLSSDEALLAAFQTKLGRGVTREDSPGNTVAVGRGPRGPAETRMVTLRTTPWRPPTALAELQRRKQEAWESQRDAYTGLSAAQMNHRPSNGAHTVRWNTEHIAGRELLFFSSVLSHLDPEIEPVDLNPRQFPEEYEPAHPDWTGDEEVRHVERVHAFTRRFAYLLDGLPLDELPAGAPEFAGSLRGLYELMEGHYAHHTQHVRKKFELPDWPRE